MFFLLPMTFDVRLVMYVFFREKFFINYMGNGPGRFFLHLIPNIECGSLTWRVFLLPLTFDVKKEALRGTPFFSSRLFREVASTETFTQKGAAHAKHHDIIPIRPA